MKAALLEFELDSSTQHVGPFYAGVERTVRYWTREAVCSALTYADRFWQDKTAAYQPLVFPFDSTPAEPVEVHTADVVYRAGDKSDQGILRFGTQELMLPGSRFRCALWGDLPTLFSGQVFLIGKKRAPARIVHLLIDEIEPDYHTEGQMLPIQLSPNEVTQFPAFMPLHGTSRYFIVKLPLMPSMLRFAIGGFLVPLPES